MSFSDPISPLQPSSAEVEPSSGQSSATAPPAESATHHLPVARIEDPVWGPLDVLLIALFAVLAIFVVGGVAIAVAHSLPRFHNVKLADLAQNAAVIVPAETVAYLFLLAFMVQIVRMRNRGRELFSIPSPATPARAGDPGLWNRPAFPPHTSQELLPRSHADFLTSIRWNMPRRQAAALALVGGVGLALASGIFESLLHKWVPKTLPIDELFRDRNSAYLFSFFGVLVAPFIEEIFFRGFLYPVLAKKLEPGTAIVLTAAAFAVIHQQQLAHAWVPLLWLFVVGLILTYVRARTKSVATSVLIHISYNCTLFVLLYIATQGFRHF